MNATLDLNLLPMVRLEGQDLAEFPGLYGVKPPRRTARGRQSDYLVLYLSITGNTPLVANQQPVLLERLAQAYYKSPGTVTAAMRSVAEALNQFLWDRNVRGGSGKQSVALLTQVVLRNGLIFLAHSGAVHAYHIRPEETQEYFDPQGSGRGLGIGRTITLRYYQLNIQVGDFLFLAHQPAQSWTPAALQTVAGQTLEAVRRRLLAQAGTDFNAVLVQIQPGTGKLRLLRVKPAFQDMARPVKTSEPPAAPSQPPESTPEQPPSEVRATETDQEEQAEEVSPAELPASGDGAPAPLTSEDRPSVETPKATESEQPAAQMVVVPQSMGAVPTKIQPVEPMTAQSSIPDSRPVSTRSAMTRQRTASGRKAQPQPIKSKPVRSPSLLKTTAGGIAAGAGRAVANVFKALGVVLGKILHLLGSIFKRILPDHEALNISPATLIFLAFAIPILIGVVGGMVYIERGQQLQFDTNYRKALDAAAQAVTKTEVGEKRLAWKAVLVELDQAEKFKVTEDSQKLRFQAQGVLDNLDAVDRIDFQTALAIPLDSSVKISRMVATSNELYLLDSVEGKVYYAELTGRGFEIDPDFICGPVSGQNPVGPLIDIVSLPRGTQQGATIAGLDVDGNILYCIPKVVPFSQHLAYPLTNFGSLKGMALDAGDLYIMDPSRNAVWVYPAMKVDEVPHQFLGEKTSFMPDVIDMVVAGEDVFLLHADGHQTKCVGDGQDDSPTQCDDPFAYTDSRVGRQNGAVIPDSLFDQFIYSPPPDPSLYLLDPMNQAIFRFSLRLNFQQQYRSIRSLPEGPATAFAVSPTRILFMAVGSQVFYAALP
jgi:hypothetical protein